MDVVTSFYYSGSSAILSKPDNWNKWDTSLLKPATPPATTPKSKIEANLELILVKL